MSARILMVLPEFYPDDIRVSKEIRALQSAGYTIHLLCYKRTNEDLEEVINGVEITRVNGASTFNQKGITDILTAIFFIHPYFLKGLRAVKRNHEFQAIHVHDLPLFRTAKRVFKHIPIILDMHENYPEAMKVWFQWKKNPLIRLKNRIFFGFNRWSRFEKKALRKADRVIAVVDEMKDRAIAQDSTLDESKFQVVSNTEEVSFLNQTLDQEVFKEYAGKFIISYTGNVGPHRGVDTLIKSAKYLKDLAEIQLLIIGKLSNDTQDHLKKLIQAEELSNVELWGYRPFDKFYSYMKQSSINVIPHNRNGHTDHTIPHKLFQAMMCNRPVIVSDCKPLNRVVSQSHSGLIFKANDAEDLAKRIRELYEDRNLYQTVAKNGFEATVKGQLNWEHEGKKLISMYQSIMNT